MYQQFVVELLPEGFQPLVPTAPEPLYRFTPDKSEFEGLFHGSAHVRGFIDETKQLGWILVICTVMGHPTTFKSFSFITARFFAHPLVCTNYTTHDC